MAVGSPMTFRFSGAMGAGMEQYFDLHMGGGMMSSGGVAVDYTAGLGMGGQWIMGGMMTGTHGGMGWGMMGSGWHHANGSYGMVFTFTTA